MAAKQAKTVDRQKVLTKLTKQLKKEFGRLPRKRDALPVLETMLYAVCLEDASPDDADVVFERLQNDFFDWNEVRVSTISELEPTFEGLPDPARRAMRVRYLLYYVFDHQFSYDFDSLKRKPLELVHKQLSKIKHLTPFARNYLLQNSLGTHVLPVDSRMLRVAVYLGLVPARATVENAPDLLKTMVRKPDGLEFMWLLKSLSVAPKAEVLFDEDDLIEDVDIADAETQLSDLMSGRFKRRVQTVRRKHAAEKAAKAKASAAKKAAAERARKKAERESAAAEKKQTGKASAKKSAGGRKSAAKKKTSAKKTKAAKKKTTAKKKSAARKKATGRKKTASTKKASAKKAAKKKKTSGRKKK